LNGLGFCQANGANGRMTKDNGWNFFVLKKQRLNEGVSIIMMMI
jgi:hypothetical protein